MKSILRPVRQWAERCPDKLLFEFLDVDGRTKQSYTYSGFIQRTTDIASYLHREHPMPRGSRVLLAYPPGLEMICAFFACARLGLIPVPVCDPAARGTGAAVHKMGFVAKDCDASAILTDASTWHFGESGRARKGAAAPLPPASDMSGLRWISSSEADPGAGEDFDESHSEVLFLQYTSGSTSDPKGVMVTHDNILHNCDAVVDHLPVGVSWLPQYHDMGLIGYYLFFALKGGTTYGFSPTDFIRRPALWLETISRRRGTASSAPNFAYEYCLRPNKIPPEVVETLDLSSLRFLMTAAEPVSAEVYGEFLRRFKPCGLNPRSFFSAYGLAENTLAVTNYGRVARGFDRGALSRKLARTAAFPGKSADARVLVSCGKPLPGNEVRIVNAATQRCDGADGTVGEIWVRGPSKCLGYWNRPELTAAVFQATLPGSRADRTWLRTGDLGFLNDGELYVYGRAKDLIIVRGLNYYPQDIEMLVGQDVRVRTGCVTAFMAERDGQERLVVVAKVRNPKCLPNSRDLQRLVLERLGVAISVFVYVRGRTVARTSSGKVARHLVRRRFDEGGLDIVSQVELAAPTGAEPAADSAHDQSPPAPEPGFGAVFRKYGLSGNEPWSLPDAGLDSLRLVELAEDLKTSLSAKGHVHLAEALDLRMLQQFSIRQLNELLSQLGAAGSKGTERLEDVVADLRREHRKAEQEMMRRDTRLRFDPARLPARAQGAAGAPEGVLLTGGTGFFGPFLLASLIRQTRDPIYVLVRADDESDARRRLRAGLAALSPGTSDLSDLDARVRPVCGDLGQANLGLTAECWNALAEKVHTIYHNGARVNYLLDYAAMRDVNVGGTNELVRLAMSHQQKVFNHISTTFVFGWSVKGVLYERDNNADMDLLDFGYSQSKWVSEQVVFDAMRHGLKARIFRPALITPSLEGGGCNLDISIRLLAFMLKHRIGTTARNQVSFSPADLTADNIVAISQLTDNLGQTFHVTRDTYTNMVEITRILGELTNVSFRNFKLADFVPEVIDRCRPGDILFPLLDFFVRSAGNITAMEFKRYDNSQYAHARDASAQGKADPPLKDVVLGILRYMRRQGVVTN